MKVLQVFMLVESIELGPLRPVKRSERKYIVDYTTKNKQEMRMAWYNVICPPEEILFWEFIFGNKPEDFEDVGELNFEPTGNGEQYEILQQGLKFCDMFKEEYNPGTVGCSYKHPSQKQIYLRMLKRIWPEFEFRVVSDHPYCEYIIGSKR